MCAGTRIYGEQFPYHVYPVEADRDDVGAPVGSRGAGAVAGRDPSPVECHRNVVLLAEATRRDHQRGHRCAQMKTWQTVTKKKKKNYNLYKRTINVYILTSFFAPFPLPRSSQNCYNLYIPNKQQNTIYIIYSWNIIHEAERERERM